MAIYLKGGMLLRDVVAVKVHVARQVSKSDDLLTPMGNVPLVVHPLGA